MHVRPVPPASGVIDPAPSLDVATEAGRWSNMRPGADVLGLLAVMALALAARLYRIGAQSFWLDEVFTWQRIQLPPAQLIADSFANRHFPSYFLLLRWIASFDPGDFAWLRMPSAVFGAAATGMVFLTARRLGGRTAGIVAGLLMALSPLQMQYGQEARPYALVVLLIAIALWGLVLIVQQPLREAVHGRSAGIRWARGWIAYVAGTVGASSVLGDTAPWLLASNVALWLVWRKLRVDAEAARGFRRHWLASQVVVLLGCLPFYGGVLGAADRHALQAFNWIPALTWHHLWVVASTTYLMHGATVVRLGLLPMAVKMLSPLVALFGCLGFLRLRGRMEGRALLLAFAVLPLLVLAVSLVKPMLVPRYILWSSVPFFVVAGVGAATVGRRVAPLLVAMLLVLSLVNLAPLYRIEIKPRWNAAAATLAAEVRPGDTVFTDDPNGPLMLEALRPAEAEPIGARALVTQRWSQALAHWQAGGRLWAVSGRAAMGEREDLAAFKRRLAPLGQPVREFAEGSELTLLQFAPARAGAAGAAAVDPALR